MLPILVDPHWSLRFPDARMGLLEVHGLEPLATHPRLEKLRLALEQELRERVRRPGPASSCGNSRPCGPSKPTTGPFGRTYHVLQQLESVAVEGPLHPRPDLRRDSAVHGGAASTAWWPPGMISTRSRPPSCSGPVDGG